MNLAVAGRTEAFGLFGSTPILTYSKRIHAIVPPGGMMPDGMVSGYYQRRRLKRSRRISDASKRERDGLHYTGVALLFEVGRDLRLEDLVGIARRARRA